MASKSSSKPLTARRNQVTICHTSIGEEDTFQCGTADSWRRWHWKVPYKWMNCSYCWWYLWTSLDPSREQQTLKRDTTLHWLKLDDWMRPDPISPHVHEVGVAVSPDDLPTREFSRPVLVKGAKLFKTRKQIRYSIDQTVRRLNMNKEVSSNGGTHKSSIYGWIF